MWLLKLITNRIWYDLAYEKKIHFEDNKQHLLTAFNYTFTDKKHKL